MKKTNDYPTEMKTTRRPESEARFSNAAKPSDQGLAADHMLAIFESVPGLYLILTPDAPTFTIVAVSDAYAQATMTRREKILGKGLFEVFPDNPDDPNATGVKNLTASLMRVLKYKKPHKMAVQQYDIRKPGKEGGAFELRYWSPLNSPVLDTTGEVAYLVHSVVDVTDVLQSKKRKEAAEQKATELQLLYSELLLAQQKVQESEAYFRALANATSDIIYRMSADWAEMRELDGRTFLADTGQPIHNWLEKYIYPQDQQQVMKVIQEAIQTKSIFQLEHQVKRADGSAGWTFSRAIPILDTHGEIVEWFGAASDITERKKAKELEYQYRCAEEANRVRSQFLSTMSHELRTPLASIIGFSQLLLDDAAARQLSEQQRVNLRRILKNGQHLLGLVSDVLDLEKIDAGRMEITYAPVDVRELLTSVVEEMQAMAIERHLLLRAEVEEGVNLLESHEVKLRQVLLNLVSNALKYSDHGEVLVSARLQPANGEVPDAVVLAVKDTGIGIPSEVQERVFEAFYQVEGGYTRKVGGAGLGLAIATRLITLLGGIIELTSVPEQGSTFTVTLPLKATSLPKSKQFSHLHPTRETPDLPTATFGEQISGGAQPGTVTEHAPLVLATEHQFL